MTRGTTARIHGEQLPVLDKSATALEYGDRFGSRGAIGHKAQRLRAE